MQDLVRRLIAATNAFDVDGTLTLFSPDAVISDVSVGDKFVGTSGVRTYFERFFVGYKTVSTLLDVQMMNTDRALVRLDFVGDFGHETGVLDITVAADGRIVAIDAGLD